MIKKLSILLSSITLLSSCGNANNAKDIKWVSPLGAPSVAFYTEGKNSNWVSESASLLPAELQGNFYDAVIFDSITGLASIKLNNSDFALARVLTGGNFYLVGINKEGYPTSEDRIVAFQKDKVPDKVFKKVATEKWNIDTNNVEYVSGDVSSTAAVLKTGKYQNNDVDYVLTAEPVYTSSKNAATEAGITLNEICSLKSEWKDLTGQNAIIQAGVFVRKSVIDEKKEQFNEWFTLLDERVKHIINNDSIVVDSLNAYGEAETQKNRFGVASTIISAVQNNAQNRLGFVSKEENANLSVNAFLTSLGETTYEDSYFVNFN